MQTLRVLIMGAAGRDFHNFNTFFRGNPAYQVVGFTATQIPDIDGRSYPASLAGPGYPDGIRIYPEDDLAGLIREHDVHQVVFAYSDVPHSYVMHRASTVLAAGADFVLLGPGRTAIKSTKPVVAVCAVRTGVGKSQTTRRVAQLLRGMGHKVVVIRHPMPYGDLSKQVCQRFATYGDLDLHKCTIEEREEYEPHIDCGSVVYAGVDYGVILREAEKEADVILWDGGNNDFSFYVPDLLITLVDPHRPGHELMYFPGEVNLKAADVVIINKIDTAGPQGIETVRRNIQAANPRAAVINAASPIFVEGGEAIRGQRVLVIEDGPTVTHGDMGYGAGVIAARKFGAAVLVDPRPYAVGSIASTFAKYTHLTDVLPAMGYGAKQVSELERTINAVPCDLVIAATPIDLRRVARIERPALRVRYELEEIGRPNLEDVLARFRR
jgi:predicted GTPase